MNPKEEIIQNIILEMTKPFSIDELFTALQEQEDILDVNLVLKVLDRLLNSGLVSYSDISDDVGVLYCSAFATK